MLITILWILLTFKNTWNVYCSIWYEKDLSAIDCEIELDYIHEINTTRTHLTALGTLDIVPTEIKRSRLRVGTYQSWQHAHSNNQSARRSKYDITRRGWGGQVLKLHIHIHQTPIKQHIHPHTSNNHRQLTMMFTSLPWVENSFEIRFPSGWPTRDVIFSPANNNPCYIFIFIWAVSTGNPLS